jgi:hypothetical protein
VQEKLKATWGICGPSKRWETRTNQGCASFIAVSPPHSTFPIMAVLGKVRRVKMSQVLDLPTRPARPRRAKMGKLPFPAAGRTGG